MLNALMAEDWVVYLKNCLRHTETVVDYLARYTHRIAIINARIAAVDEAHVTFHYKDYRDAGRHKLLRLKGDEFVRRFLLHIVPKGLMRVRHFGFLANRGREEKLTLIRRTLKVTENPVSSDCAATDAGIYQCPQCHHFAMRVTAQLLPAFHPDHRHGESRCLPR